MAALLKAGYGFAVHVADLTWNYCDPRTCDYYFVKSPIPMAIIIAVYLYFVLSLGPKLMKNREPFKLKNLMLVYNALQVIWCAHIVIESWRLAWGNTYSFICTPFSFAMDPENLEIAWVVYQYYLLKMVDLLDTVFMVLRKNDRQISFLHVYHHAFMVFGIWIATKTQPGGHSSFLGFINSIVHCILYGYYFLTLWRPQAKVAWWKKYITIVQIIQFGTIMVHEAFPLLLVPSCDVYKLISGVVFIQAVYMFLLFSDFYRKTYYRKSAAQEKVKM